MRKRCNKSVSGLLPKRDLPSFCQGTLAHKHAFCLYSLPFPRPFFKTLILSVSVRVLMRGEREREEMLILIFMSFLFLASVYRVVCLLLLAARFSCMRLPNQTSLIVLNKACEPHKISPNVDSIKVLITGF